MFGRIHPAGNFVPLQALDLIAMESSVTLGHQKTEKRKAASRAGIVALIEALLDGIFTETGRWVLSLFGLQSNAFAEAFLGFLVWISVILLALVLFAALV